MWGIIQLINSIFISIVGVFLIYAVGAALIRGEWRELLVAVVLFIFLGLSEVAIAAIQM